ncbi:MAG: hypothetical protein DPW18_08560 [Chloroflexi bacterium]|nr:hypothetical protein [Chloroflexota bacterium]MDL1941826.1 DUF3592 domain-containing protein [Chloroflexi bacterium CFX2]
MILLIAVPLGLFIIAKTLFEINNGNASRKWSTTQGVVTHSGEFTTHRVSDGIMRKSTSSFFQYEYTVNGEKQIGTRIFFGDFFLSMIGINAGKKYAAGYEIGQTVTVYYKPSKPADSVLLPGVKNLVYAGFAAGMGVIAAGFLLLYI